MATYGEPGKNPYTIKGVGGVLSNVVNAETGVTQVYRQGAFNRYQSLGTYNPQTKKFTPDSSLSENEKTVFSSQESVNSIKNSAEVTAKKSQIDSGITPDSADKRSKELLNTGKATTPPQAGDGSTPSTPPETGKELTGTKTSGFGNFIYPEGLGSTKQDVIKFTMLEYQPSGVGAVGQQGDQKTLGFGNKRGSDKDWSKDRKIAGTATLPIPSGISDTNAADWGQNSMNALEAALAGASYEAITEGIGSGISQLGLSAEAAAGEENTKKAIGSAFAAAAMGGSQSALLSRAEGVVINPNMELLFNGPQLRPFTFTFKMSARSKTEAQQIIKIINFFKRGMSPIKTESTLFLKAPNTFKIQYLHLGQSGKDHPYIGRIKECALQTVTVSYTPEGQYATFYDGVLVSYEMSMQFQELEPIFNSDYDGLEGIGY